MLSPNLIDTVTWIDHPLSPEEEEAIARLDLDVSTRRRDWEVAKFAAAQTSDPDLLVLPYWSRVRAIFLQAVRVQ